MLLFYVFAVVWQSQTPLKIIPGTNAFPLRLRREGSGCAKFLQNARYEPLPPLSDPLPESPPESLPVPPLESLPELSPDLPPDSEPLSVPPLLLSGGVLSFPPAFES